MEQTGTRIFRVVRNFLFSIVNKEFLIFLFFLLVSATFWVLTTLNETYEREIAVPLKLVNVPKGVVITSDMNDTLKVTIRDRGYFLFAYKFGNIIRPISIDFKNYSKNANKGTVPASDLQKQIYHLIYNSSRIVTMKPDHWEFYFTQGQKKSVPLGLRGKVIPGQSYYIARVSFQPERVDVYARQSLLDSIRVAYTDVLDVKELTDTIVRTVSLQKIKGVKYVPSEVKVTIYPDILTEGSMEIPVTAVNMPPGRVLRTFPARIRVSYVVGASNVRSVKPDQFKVETDYRDIEANPSEKCALRLVQLPRDVKNARLEVDHVDYLIEEQ